MKLASALRVGDVLQARLDGDKGPVQRVVTKVRPRIGLTQIHTEHKVDRGKREIWELRSDLEVVVN